MTQTALLGEGRPAVVQAIWGFAWRSARCAKLVLVHDDPSYCSGSGLCFQYSSQTSVRNDPQTLF